jgi:two-component system, OmpR family, KDP operon response regulator KdpE
VTRRVTEPELIEPVQLGRWTVDLSDHVIFETLPANRGASDTQLQSDNIDELAHRGQIHYLRQYVKALRHKLEDDPTRPRNLITEPGMGYRFQP